MSDKIELARRKTLTFEQAEGISELPRQLKRDEMPDVLRARLLDAFTQAITREMNKSRLRISLGPHWSGVFRRWAVEHLGEVTATHVERAEHAFKILTNVFRNLDTLTIYGAVQMLVRLDGTPALADQIGLILNQQHAAYRLVDSDTLIPVGSDEEAITFTTALKTTVTTGMQGASTHLRKAAADLSTGAYADSIRESIHAVESVARASTQKTKLQDAIAELAKQRPIHPALQKGILQLYGFGSDEPGVRHPLLDKSDAAVTEADAMLVLGVCAAVVTYLAHAGSPST